MVDYDPASVAGFAAAMAAYRRMEDGAMPPNPPVRDNGPTPPPTNDRGHGFRRGHGDGETVDPDIPTPPPMDGPQRTHDLAGWWRDITDREINQVVPKAIEYGAADLQIMGDALLVMMPHLAGKVDGRELACAFYALGKVARTFGAYADGRSPSDDCWHDLGVYARMVQRIRQTGQWP